LRTVFYGNGDGNLKGNNFMAIITAIAPEQDYRSDGKAHFRVHELCKNLEQAAY